MTKIRYYLIGCLVGGGLYAGTWTRTIGDTANDCGYSICWAEDSGYALAGYTESYGVGMTDAWLIRTDSIGIPIWQKTFGGPDSDGIYSMCKTIDSGYIMAGYTKSFGAGGGDVWVIRTDINGDTVWTRTYGDSGNDCAYSVKQTIDSGYIVSGMTDSGKDAWLLKIKGNGDTAWTKVFKGYGYGRCVCQTFDSGYILTGYADSLLYGGKDGWLIETDANGDTSWTKVFGNSSYNDYLFSVIQTSDTGYAMTGSITINSVNYLRLIKTDSMGGKILDYVFPSYTTGIGYSIMEGESNNYIIVASGTPYYASINGAIIIKTVGYYNCNDAHQYFGGQSSGGVYSFVQAYDSTYIMAGKTNSYGAGKSDLWIVKTGKNTWARLTPSVEENSIKKSLSFSISPNPVITSAKITISCNNQNGIKLTLYDITGREKSVLFDGNVGEKNTITLNTSLLNPGKYFLRMEGNGNTVVKGITVLK